MPRGLLTSVLHRTSLLLVAVVAAASACGREPTGMGATGSAALVFKPAFQTTQAKHDGDVTSIQVTLWLVNPAAAAGASARRKELKAFRFSLGSKDVVETDASVTVKVEFPLQGEGSAYEVDGGAYDASGVLLYAITPVGFNEKQLGTAGGVSVTSTVTYVGPGSNATRVEIVPRALTINQGQTGQFSASVFAATAPVSKAIVRWVSLNPSVAAFTDDRSGVVTGVSRGTTKVVVAVEGTKVTDTATVTVNVAPTGLQLVSGGGQTGAPGSQLSQAIVVRLVAGTAAVSGVAVTFSAGSGGSVTAATVVTDAIGQASTRWTLGAASGSQTLTVGSAGVSNLTVSATAVSTVRTVTFLSLTPSALTPGQSSVVLVQVRDGSGAAVVGETVSFSASGTGNTLSPATATTNSAGQASTSFTSTDVGTKTLTASISGASAQTSLTVAANNSTVATQLVKVSGDGQTVRIGQVFGAPIVVEARNAAGQPVAGAFVDFGTLAGTARQVTGADGRASVLYSVSPLASPGTGSIAVTLFPNSAIAVVFTYTAIP